MLQSRPSRFVASLVVLGALAAAGRATPVAAQSVPLLPAGVRAVPVVGAVGVVVPPIIVVPPIGIGTQHAHVTKDRERSRERADVTIGGE